MGGGISLALCKALGYPVVDKVAHPRKELSVSGRNSEHGELNEYRRMDKVLRELA